MGSGSDASTSTGALVTGSSDSSSSSALDEGSSSTSRENPSYPECEEPEATIVVTTAMSPDGPLQIDEAWLGLALCFGTPYVVLVQHASARTGPKLEFEMLLVGESEPTFLGPYPAELFGDTGPVPGTIDVLEPFDHIESEVPDPSPPFHARLEVHEGGWELDVEVELIYCGEAKCFCPCE